MEKFEEMNYASDKDIAYLEEIDNKMDIISTRAIWLMGVMVLIILALASFIAQNLGTSTDGLAWLINITARALCVLYSMTLLAYIPLLIIPKFGNPINKKYTHQQQQKNIKNNEENLEKLYRHFKTLIGLFIFFPTASFAVIGAGYVVL